MDHYNLQNFSSLVKGIRAPQLYSSSGMNVFISGVSHLPSAPVPRVFLICDSQQVLPPVSSANFMKSAKASHFGYLCFLPVFFYYVSHQWFMFHAWAIYVHYQGYICVSLQVSYILPVSSVRSFTVFLTIITFVYRLDIFFLLFLYDFFTLASTISYSFLFTCTLLVPHLKYLSCYPLSIICIDPALCYM